MIARAFALGSLIVVCIAVADLMAHPTETTTLVNSGVTAEKVTTNALLGKTS